MEDRRHKSALTRASEIVTLLIGLGVFGLFVRIGEFKANFAALQQKVCELKTLIDANAGQNEEAHFQIRCDVEKTQQAIVAYTGKVIK